jgi:hypothetical protein
MDLTYLIESAEYSFKRLLEDFFISVFDDRYLPSHGLDHHRRVWNYCSELMQSVYHLNNSLDPSFPAKLIIACYLHDIGMSVDPGMQHGKYSGDLCRTFLMRNGLIESDYSDVLEAIENHDSKEYKESGKAYDLLTLLTVADDLDAFGFTGIYRYSEIYLARGIGFKETGTMIQANAASRFSNFTGYFGSDRDLTGKQKNRYEILRDFFDEYIKEAARYDFNGRSPAGHCGVLELILNMLNNKLTLKEFYDGIDKYPDDDVIMWFFRGLEKELWH